MATDITMQAASASLLGLPAEIRVMIIKTVFAGLRYSHDDEDYDTVQKHGFASRKLQSDDGKSRWKPEDYYDFLGATFPSLKHIKYVPKLDGADECSISYVISSLRGKFDVSYRNTFLRADGLLCAAPAEGESAFNFTVNIAVEYALTFGGKDWRNLLLDIYHLDVNAFTGEIVKRWVNLNWPELFGPDNFVPASECCIMANGVSWPVLYHVPSGQMRVLICQRELDSDYFIEAIGLRAARNAVAVRVENDLTCEETLKKALEQACGLKERSADVEEETTNE